ENRTIPLRRSDDRGSEVSNSTRVKIISVQSGALRSQVMHLLLEKFPAIHTPTCLQTNAVHPRRPSGNIPCPFQQATGKCLPQHHPSGGIAHLHFPCTQPGCPLHCDLLGSRIGEDAHWQGGLFRRHVRSHGVHHTEGTHHAVVLMVE